MAEYRIFFLDDHGVIVARDEFKAEFDSAAIQIADMLFDACSDCLGGYELWSGARRILPAGDGQMSRRRNGSQTPSDMSGSIQLIVAERERILLDSHWTVARSTKLLAEAKKLHELLDITIPPAHPR